MMPRWSPDGKSLAYLSGLGVMEAGQLVLLDVTTGEARELAYGATMMRWSPDSQRLAFCGSDWKTFEIIDPLLGPQGPLALALVGADGQGFRKITDARYTEIGEWSPDGTQLLYTTWKSQDEPGELWVTKVDGSPPRPLATQVAGLKLLPHLSMGAITHVAGPGAWSPDGQWVVYPGDQTAPGLWMVNVASQQRQQVLQEPVSFVQWVRTGPGLFYLQGEAGKANLWLLRARDRQRLQITTSGNLVEALASPTGRQVAVVVWEQRGDPVHQGAEAERFDTYILTLKGEAAP
jgi:Tol biopolymer transport system component